MEFKAREAYRDEATVKGYDDHRFTSLKGRFTDWLEKRTIEKAIKSAGIEKNALLLDVPCGTGRLSIHLANQGYNVIGVDISPAMVNLCSEKSAHSRLSDKLKFEVADAEKFSFEDKFFDAVVSLRLFGHVPPDLRKNMLREFKRVSKSYLIVAYYHSNSLQCMLRRKKRNTMDIPWYPVTFKVIHDELRTAGLSFVKAYPMALGISETVVVVAKAI